MVFELESSMDGDELEDDDVQPDDDGPPEGGGQPPRPSGRPSLKVVK
jgi:stringent starvation protein B